MLRKCPLAALFFILGLMPAVAADWPQWRYGPRRGAMSEDKLPEKLHLQWWKDLGTPDPAWPATQEKLQFDAGYEPVVAGERIFVPSMIHDSVTAYSTRTGEELWRFYTNGPVRFAPACSGDAVYVVSDDGYLYCLRQSDGRVRWKFRGGPSDRKVLGNGRLISTWAARGAPVIEDGVLYFAAGVWPFMGVFIHAIDVDSGEAIWTNSGSGANYLVQPHGSPAFAGVSPQGYLALTNDTLIVPGGRGVPAGYDKQTGEFLFCHVGNFGKRSGGYDVTTGDQWLCNRGVFCCAYSGSESDRHNVVAAGEELILTQSGSKLTALGGKPESKVTERRSRRGGKFQQREFSFDKRWDTNLPSGIRTILCVAGDTAYGTDGAQRIVAFQLPVKDGQPPNVVWEDRVVGNIWNLLAADDRLFVATREGGLFCFGEQPKDISLPAAEKFMAPPKEPASKGIPLVARRSVWKFLDDGSDQKSHWRTPDFDDERWQQGRAELGYGDGDEVTKIDFGDSKRKHLTYYFRREFEVPSDLKIDTASMQAKVDDGAVFYLNGNEFGRLSMPNGEVHHDTPAKNADSEDDYHAVKVDPKMLRPGRNLLAVEVHQRSPSSSDVSFDLELLVTAKENAPPSSTESANEAILAGEIEIPRQLGGYVLAFGAEHAETVSKLASGTDMQVIVVEGDAARANELRRELQENDLLGRRVAVLNVDWQAAELPPYLSSLTLAPNDIDLNAGSLRTIFRGLRPYGGVAVCNIAEEDEPRFVQAIADANLQNAQWKRHGQHVALTRVGPLPDSAPWTQQGASVANTMMSDDLRVKAPLGLLWFGGPSHAGVLPRHGHGPTPQVVGGRLFIEGRDFLRATDVYTGRLLWQRELPGVGMYYDNTGHHPGANAIGSNYVSVADAVYVAYGRECLRLDPATGETLAKFTLPKIDGEAETPYFGYIGVYEDWLIAGSSPTVPWTKSHGTSTGELQSRFAEGSQRLVVMNRNSGKVLWQRKAEHNFRHNAICAGGAKIYCIDRITDARRALLKRRGIEPEGEPALYAFDALTGEIAWQSSQEIFGTWLSYSDEHGILVQATASFRDRARDEPDNGIAAYDASSGKRLWKSDAGYGGPVLLTGDRIITQGTAFDLKTGEAATRVDPITGETSRWTFTRNYGCNTAIGCPNLLTFRSAAAGFFDLASDGGTGNLGGFRSSCTSNLVPADGVLNAPDYTRTCTCSYQLQCSLAFVHMPEAEMWTFQPMAWNGDRVKRIGINFGAPGDRRQKDGSLWIDYPSVGGRSPDLPIDVAGEQVEYFRRHASSLGDDPLAWVASSGVHGARTITVKLATRDEKPRNYTVRLVWGAGGDLPNFDVALQRKPVGDTATVGRGDTADGRIATSAFRNVPIAKELEITLTPNAENSGTVLCGVEIILQE